MKHPFEGLKVLDFCWVVIGPMTTRYFSDYGATVIRVESGLRPDVIRHGLPFAGNKPGVNRSGYWANYNSGKLGLSLNMSDHRAREIAFKLATEWADVITENFTPGTIEKWGLSYDKIKNKNPGVVMFSASMLGRGGPYDAQPGFGPVLTALSGHTNFTGWPDRVPVSPYGAYTDFLVPYLAFSAICAALDEKRRTGIGQYLDLSQLEASLYFLGTPVMDFLANNNIQERSGNQDPGMAPHGIYKCFGNDRWCAIACESDQQWRSLAKLIGQPQLEKDVRFSSLAARKANSGELDKIVEQWTILHGPDEVMNICQSEGVPAGSVRDSKDLFADPQHIHRKHFIYMEHAEMGTYASDSSGLIMSETQPNYRPAPLLGEHTHKVITEMLGMSNEEFSFLLSEGVFD